MSVLPSEGLVRLRALENAVLRRLRSPEASALIARSAVGWDVKRLERHRFCLLATYRRNGSPVATPVWFGVDGEIVYLRSGASDGKVKRIRSNPRVMVAACTMLGRPLGPPMMGTARLIRGERMSAAERALRDKYGVGRRVYGLVRAPLLEMVYISVTAESTAATCDPAALIESAGSGPGVVGGR